MLSRSGPIPAARQRRAAALPQHAQGNRGYRFTWRSSFGGDGVVRGDPLSGCLCRSDRRRAVSRRGSPQLGLPETEGDTDEARDDLAPVREPDAALPSDPRHFEAGWVAGMGASMG
jgi:hypothetical protein